MVILPSRRENLVLGNMDHSKLGEYFTMYISLSFLGRPILRPWLIKLYSTYRQLYPIKSFENITSLLSYLLFFRKLMLSRL